MNHNVEQTFMPGSEWAFFKIYVSPIESDTLLSKYLYPLILRFQSERYIDKWFFIRYTDPEYHLRVRLHLTDTDHWGKIITAMNSKLKTEIDRRIVHKIIIDTYVRELERYGHRTMELCESLFCVNSDATCRIIKNCIGEGQNISWMHGIIVTDCTLKLFFDNLDIRLHKISHISDCYNIEFGYSPHNLKQINSLYRRCRKDIEDVMQGNVYYTYKKFVVKNSIIKFTPKEIDKILPSLLHMNMNRLFTTQQRMYEMVIYNFLRMAYRGMIARHSVHK